jgi:outer membrane protein OmpA-like peptidoglycan-associated protein
MRTALWIGSALLGVLAFSPAARAEERWLLNGAGSFAGPISDPYERRFASGAMGDIGLYRSLVPQLLLGARVSGGVLSHDDTVEGTAQDSGEYGLGMVSGALRLRPLARANDPHRGTGLWLEAAAGPGIAEDEVRAVLSPGLGYVFGLGSVGVGPVARYVHVIERSDNRFGGNDAQLATIGVEAIFLDAGERRGTTDDTPGGEYQPPAPLQPAARVEGDIDRDGFVDSKDSCPRQPETVNGINDHDGCPDSKVEFLDDRLVLDEQVLFAYDSAELQPTGQQRLQEMVALHKRTGHDWKRLTLKGHADERGPQDYNEDLSRRRAEAVKRYLMSIDFPEALIDIQAFGERKPVVPAADTEAEHRQNRRVEFVIGRE